jgi:glucose/arabinose dehydrogenase
LANIFTHKIKREKMGRVKIHSLIKIILIFISVFNSVTISAQTFPSGFSQVKVASIADGSAMAFAPDGRLFICQKAGKVMIIKNGTLLTTPFLTLTVDVNGERGISGIAFDPNFSTNNYIYIYYTTTSPTIHNRLSRFTANGDVVVSGSELVLLDLETVNSIYHNGGGIGFGIDGKLYLSIGEDNSPNNAQSFTTLKGKLIRINSDGTAASGNPYYNSTNANTKKIWCMGLRNPYTMAIQKSTGRIFINNVGADTYEEINDGTQSGQNFGWPVVEGYSTDTAYDNPFYAYNQTDPDHNGCAITGGTFFNPSASNYPSVYWNKYFFIDFCNGWIDYLPLTSSPSNTNFARVLTTQNLALTLGPDGNLYYLNRYDTKAGVYKIIYTNNNSPVITSQPASQTVTAGQPATFSVAASGANPLSYQWKKNGTNISGANSSSYTISSAQSTNQGQYSVLVSNAYGSVLSNTASLTVTAFNAAPVATISSPVNNSLYRAGDTIYFSGDATDAEDGTLAASTFTWTVQFHHNNDHFHPGPVIPAGIKSGSFIIPNTGEPSATVFYRLKLIVKDSHQLTDTAYIDLLPRTSTINIQTNPAGLQITFDNQPKASPFTTLTVEGLNIPIGVVSPQSKNGLNYVFDHWSNGGAANKTILVGVGDSSYTAFFRDTTILCTASGKISREVWNNVTTSSLSGVPFTTAPTSNSDISLFEGPSNVADNYSSRIRGYICPPQSGNYTFWIASDNNSELWLSTDTDPAKKAKIAYVSGYTTSREWIKYSTQKSAMINLVSGNKYYIEAVHHEGTGGDNLAVGWQLPDGTLERPIPGMRLSPFTNSSSSSDQLISSGSSWKYLDNGSNQGTAWKTHAYDDSGWKTGNAQLGYGDGDEATVVSYGGNSSNKFITTYFRKKINLSSLSGITGLELSVLRDDGAVVYINGTEVYRSNLPAGSIYYNTLASTSINGAAERDFNILNLSASTLVTGDNLVAVEIHQQSISSSDISFDLKLNAITTSTVTATPQVSISSPTNNTSYSSPANITITASASISSGSISKVDFYQGTQLIGTATSSPYSITWMNVTTGNYAVKAVATSNTNQTGTSSIVNISVTSCATPTITPSGPLRMCAGSVVLNSTTGTGFSYQWKKDGVNISGATSSSYTASVSGDYQVRVIIGDCVGWSAPAQVRIGNELAATITAGGPTTFCQGGKVTLYANTCNGYIYQWKKNGSDIFGATSSSYNATTSGDYQLKITQNGTNVWSSIVKVTVNACKLAEDSASITVLNTPSSVSNEGGDMKVFPNPNTGTFNINMRMPNSASQKIQISVINLLGEKVYYREFITTSDYLTETIQLDASLSSGIYKLQIMNEANVETVNVVLAK